VRRYVIIGSGVAGLVAAEAIRSLDSSSPLTVLSEDPFGYYSRPGLAYLLSGELDEKLLYPYQSGDYQRLGASFQRERVVRLVPDEKRLELDSGEVVHYERLLIASGSQAVRLRLPGAELRGVHKLDHLGDARRLIANARRGRTAVVTGGGITALELVEGLAARRVRVHYVLRSPRYWPNVLDEAESRIIEQRLQHDGVILHHQSELQEINGKNGQVTGVTLTSGERLRCELVAYAIGIAARTELAQAAGIACQRGILVDEYLRTNLPDIYAAGDVAQVYDPAAGEHILDSLWPFARQQGWAAGLNMADCATAYLKAVPFNVTRLAGLTTTIIGTVGGKDRREDEDVLGIARGDSETWRQLPDAIVAQDGFEVNRLRLMLGEKHILGAIVMGDQKFSTLLQGMVRDRVDITPIRARLLAPGAKIGDILAEFA
jgi:NAD(P)H-nitrite reductase large subunit